MKSFNQFISEGRPKKIDQYTPAPPKPKRKPPREREQNLSGTIEKNKQHLVAIKNHQNFIKSNPNTNINDKIVGMYAGDTEKNEPVLNESYDFNIVKPSGFGTFLTASDLGIKANPGFHLHPSVEEELEEQTKCKKNNRQEHQKKIIDD